MLAMFIFALFLIVVGFYMFVTGFKVGANALNFSTKATALFIITIGKLSALVGVIGIANLWQHINF